MTTKEYALYKGEQLLEIGTIPYIARKRGVKRDTIYHYLMPAYQRKALNVRNRMILVPLDEN